MAKKDVVSKCKHKVNKTRTIAFRVTEEEYQAYCSNKEMKELIIKYSRACLAGVYMPEF